MSNKTVNICGIQPSLEEAFKFCWSSWVDQHNILPNLTRRHAKLEKFIFGTPWLPDLLYKHWFASSVWNSCPWVTDVPPRETSPATKSEEKRMFSQAIRVWKKKLSSTTSWSLHPRTQRLEFQKSTHACAFCFCLGISRSFASDTSPKRIDREGLGKRLTGTRQHRYNVLIFHSSSSFARWQFW